MKLPLVDPQFVTSLAAAGDVFHSFSGDLPDVPRAGGRAGSSGRQGLPAQAMRATASRGADFRGRRLVLRSRLHQGGSVPLKHSTKVEEGCPKDCGLCRPRAHSCLPIIEITNHCNLECPICIVQNRNNYQMSDMEFRATIDGLIEKEGLLDTVNLSGGEPTIHPRFFELLDIARRPEISRVSISTNGLRIASDEGSCRELTARKVYVNLQFDALRNPDLRVLRGDHRPSKSARSTTWSAPV